tara:strand:- start:894 stop:1154 length:261 start_codon:yes stop_codon:yes gene_type:complete
MTKKELESELERKNTLIESQSELIDLHLDLIDTYTLHSAEYRVMIGMITTKLSKKNNFINAMKDLVKNQDKIIKDSLELIELLRNK